LRRPEALDLAWGLFAAVNVLAMYKWERWETVPFHFVWVSLTLLYGFRVWGARPTSAVLGAVVVVTGVLILRDAAHGTQEWGELFEVPLMSMMFLAMVYHGRRRQQAIEEVKLLAESRASLLERQEHFLHDASHELRTPITIARGHLELLRSERGASAELDVTLDELARMQRIVEQLLLLAQADQPDFVRPQALDLEPFLEDVFLRWSEVVSGHAWRLGPVADGTLYADDEGIRIALDALIENAVKHTSAGGVIELGARESDGGVAIDVSDDGHGLPPEMLDRIFERFARADAARTRSDGGVGLGLAIVDAIAKAHGGRCAVASGPGGSVFSLHLPRWHRALAVEEDELARAPGYAVT
jgi:signal transduction histidine kinase